MLPDYEARQPRDQEPSKILEQLSEKVPPHEWHKLLIAALTNSADTHNAHSDVLELLQTAQAAIKEVKAQNDEDEAYQRNAALGLHAVEAHKAESSQTKEKTDDSIEKKVKGILNSVTSTAFFGKFTNGLNIEPVNEHVGPLKVALHGYDDFEAVSDNPTHKKFVNAYGASVNSLLYDNLEFQRRLPANSPVFRTPLLTIGKNEKFGLVQYSFRTEAADSLNRHTKYATISAQLPLEMAEQLETLIRTNPESLELFLKGIAGGLEELESQHFSSVAIPKDQAEAINAIFKYYNDSHTSRISHYERTSAAYATIYGDGKNIDVINLES